MCIAAGVLMSVAPPRTAMQLVAYEITKLSPTEFEQRPVEHNISGLSGHRKTSWIRCCRVCAIVRHQQACGCTQTCGRALCRACSGPSSSLLPVLV